MRHIHVSADKTRQRGAALLVFMLVFFLAATTWMLARGNIPYSRAHADGVTIAALAQAKEALLGRAATDNNRPGSLTCPDIDNDGTADGNFGYCLASIGRLPWKTLDLPELLDGNGDNLWYTLSDELRDNDNATFINPQQPLQLTIDGTANMAAIVFSAGRPLASQNGRPSNNVSDYLDGINKEKGNIYQSGPSSATFNDKLLAISRNQLFSVVNRRILALFREGLGKYYAANADSYPEATADLKIVLPPFFDQGAKKLLSDNNWYAVIAYSATSDRKQAFLTIPPPTATSCTITPAEMSCIYP